MSYPERRVIRRYAVRLPLRYMAASDDVIRVGYGLSLDMSSKSILFSPDSELVPGARVELSLAWPATHNGDPLRLIVSGHVLRQDSRGVVAVIERHSLVPEAKDNLQHATAEWGRILNRFRSRLLNVHTPVPERNVAEP